MDWDKYAMLKEVLTFTFQEGSISLHMDSSIHEEHENANGMYRIIYELFLHKRIC
jgi:hypothetical protein